MRMDSFGDIYIINSNDGGNVKKGGLFVLGQPNITDYTQPTGTHQKLNISNDLNNPLGGILNIRNNRTDAGIRNDHAGSIEFSSADSAANQQTFAKIHVTAPSTTSTSEVGKMEIGVACSDDGGIDNVITITGGEKADYSTTEIAGDMKFNGNVTLDSTITSEGNVVFSKDDTQLTSFDLANKEVLAEKILVDEFPTHPHFNIAINEVKTFTTAHNGQSIVFDTFGNMFFNDYSQRKVFKATPDGTVTEHVDHSAMVILRKWPLILKIIFILQDYTIEEFTRLQVILLQVLEQVMTLLDLRILMT